MLLTTGNLVVLGIALLFVLVLRRFDRNRMQLNKIKKFSDRMLEEYVALSDGKKREFQDCVVDMDLLLKKAKIVSAGIDQGTAAARGLLESMAGQKDFLADLEQRMKATKALAGEVQKAAASVERHDSSLRRSLTQIEAMRQSLGDLEKRVPLIEKEMRSRAEERIAEQVATFGKKRLQELEEDYAARREETSRVIRGEMDTITRNLDEFETRLKSFRSESRVFEKAEALLAEFRKEIDGEEARLARLRREQKDLAKVEEVALNLAKERAEAERTINTLGLRLEELAETGKKIEQTREEQIALEARVREADDRIRDFVKETRLFERAEKLKDKLSQEIIGLEDRIGRLKPERDALARVQEQLADLKRREAEFRTMMENSNANRQALGALEKRVASFDGALSRFEGELEKKHARVEKEFAESQQELRKQISRFEQELGAVRNRNLQAGQEEFGALGKQIAEVDRRLKDYLKDSKLFERTDALADKLNGDISELNNRIAQMKEEKKDLLALRQDIAEIRHEEEAVRGMLENISFERKTLEGVEQKIESLSGSTERIEGRLQAVAKAGETIKPLESRLRELDKLRGSLDEQLSKLAEKEQSTRRLVTQISKADQTAERVEKRIEDLKGAISAIDEEKDKVHRQIENLTNQSRKFQQNEARITKVLSQFEHMGSLVSDVEKRITQLSLAQNKLESMEDRMRDLSGEADIRIDELSGLSRRIDSFFSGKKEPVAIGASARPKKASGGSPDRALNEKIFKMHDMGMDVPQIAKIVKMPINEVELRLHVRKD